MTNSHQQQPTNHSGPHRQNNSRQGFDFRSFNQASGPPGQTSSVVNSNIMNSLKDLLKNSLKQNRNNNR